MWIFTCVLSVTWAWMKQCWWKQNKRIRMIRIRPLQNVLTIHKDVTERLAQVNPALAKQARKVLDVNKSERHIRGGLATREKYLHQH